MRYSYVFLGTLAFLFISTTVFSQDQNNAFWQPVKESSIRVTGIRQIIPQKFHTFSLQGTALKDKLFKAPPQKEVNVNQSDCIISLPLPDGRLQKFRVVESPVMAEELAAAFPDMKTFSVKGIDDPNAVGRLDWNDFGFHGMILSVRGDFFIDPYCVNNTTDYLSYYTADFEKPLEQRMTEGDLYPEESQRKPASAAEEKTGAKTSSPPAGCIGDKLRSYRLAVACTGEYAKAATGLQAPTVSQTFAKILTSVNRVNTVYQREVAVELKLVSTETAVIFPDPATDPFSTGVNDNGNTLIVRSQKIIDSLIGTSNYDIGHTFSTGGGGLASLGVVCVNGGKASGITGSGSPVGDPYDIDYVAHEMGHQFRADHTFNAITGSCNGNRAAPQSVEPGSGVTIMAYAGICSGNDVSNHSIPNFHAISYDQIVAYITTGAGSVCPVTTTTGNHPPVVSISGNYVIPKSTPFVLTGSATDPDGDKLYYSWEETDAGTAAANWNSGTKPFFRSYPPDSITTTSYSRFFPKKSAVLNNNYYGVIGEYLPKTSQVLNFRLTVRDNRLGGGGVCYQNSNLVIDDSGPLTVAYPSTPSIFWLINSAQTISWEVNGTDQGAVNCEFVRILISYDGGVTYSVLVNSTPNDGVEPITVPALTQGDPNINTTCRIKIECDGNIFYDISNNNFTIATSTVYLGVQQASQNNPVGLSVWPNPASQLLNVGAGNLDSKSSTVLSVVDMLGKTVLQYSYSGRSELKESLDLSALSNGVYFIKLSNSNNQAVHRFVKN